MVGAFADAESALVALPDLRPRVGLLDIELSGVLNGVQLGMRLRHTLPELGIVLLSNHGDPQFIASLPREVIGGWSCLLKKPVSDVNALNRAIEGAAAGFVVLDLQLVTRMSHREVGALAPLTPSPGATSACSKPLPSSRTAISRERRSSRRAVIPIRRARACLKALPSASSATRYAARRSGSGRRLSDESSSAVSAGSASTVTAGSRPKRSARERSAGTRQSRMIEGWRAWLASRIACSRIKRNSRARAAPSR
jgi:CheY-like chemotaxis protein